MYNENIHPSLYIFLYNIKKYFLTHDIVLYEMLYQEIFILYYIREYIMTTNIS